MTWTDIEIKPKQDALQSFGFAEADFETALDDALGALEGRPREELPRPFNIPLMVHGKEHRLGDLAVIIVHLGPNRAVLWC
jgi:hypothetical protein